ncbi:hypothetical protein ES705_34303 [subsurface metagenome]
MKFVVGGHGLLQGLWKNLIFVKRRILKFLKSIKKIICLCPACYFLFNKYYKPEIEGDIEFEYVVDYLKPSDSKKSGSVGVQHLCQLINRGRDDASEFVDKNPNTEIDKTIYFLNSICTLDTFKHSPFITSSKQKLNERIAVCQYLSKINYENKTEHLDEIER